MHIGNKEKDKCKKHSVALTSRIRTLIWPEQWKRRLKEGNSHKTERIIIPLFVLEESREFFRTHKGMSDVSDLK